VAGMQYWVEREAAKAWINEHPSVKAWLTRHMKVSTQDGYGHAFYAFTRGVSKTPEELLEMRKAGNGWNLEKMLQDFIISGSYVSQGKHEKGRIVQMANLSKSRRKSFYTSVRDFFAQTYGENGPLALPQDRAFKIQENETRQKSRPTYIHLPDAEKIIATMKEPYHTLFTIAKYAGMGRDEILCLNKFWPSLRHQLIEGKDPIRMEFSRRKKSDQPYFTLIPASLLKPYEHVESNPFQSHDEKNRGMKPIAYYDLRAAWIGAMKRANITIPFTSHLLRDLFITGITGKAGASTIISHFMAGHSVDRNLYLQYMQEPELVVAEWNKIKAFLDGGVPPEMQDALASRDVKIERLERELGEVSTFLQHMSENWQPIPAKKAEEKYLSWDPEKVKEYQAKKKRA